MEFIVLLKFWAEHLRMRANILCVYKQQAAAVRLHSFGHSCIMRVCLVYIFLILLTVVESLQPPWR